MQQKLFEVRDTGTFIPVLATATEPRDDKELYLLARAGFRSRCIILQRLEGGSAQFDPMEWGGLTRTIPVAHAHIIENWEKLQSGDVIDVEVILGFKAVACISERVSNPL